MLQVKGRVVLVGPLQAQGLYAHHLTLLRPCLQIFYFSVKLQLGSSHQLLVHHHSSFHVLYSLFYILHVCFCIVFLLDVYRRVTSFLFFVIFFSPKIAEKVRGSKNVTGNSDSYPKCRKLYIWKLKLCNSIFRKKRRLIGGVNCMLQLETRRDVALTSKKDMTLSR